MRVLILLSGLVHFIAAGGMAAVVIWLDAPGQTGLFGVTNDAWTAGEWFRILALLLAAGLGALQTLTMLGSWAGPTQPTLWLIVAALGAADLAVLFGEKGNPAALLAMVVQACFVCAIFFGIGGLASK